MYNVFNKWLLSDMGKTIVSKHLDNMNAQRVWEEFATHMTTSSKGKAEKRRLHTYVTTTVLDKSWKGTTEQFILHFNEQFRQLDEVSPPEESLPYTTRLTLLQTAVHNIPELRMVETMEEFISLSSTTPGPTMGYDNYLTLLQNACIRYDSNLKSRPSPASRAAYQHDLSPDHPDNPYPQDYFSSGPPMVALTCQQRNSTRSILPTSIGLLMSPPLPDLDNTEPCEAFTFDDSTLEHIMDTYSPFYSVNKTHIYHVSKHSSSYYGSFIDRGANGGLAGSDVRISERTGRTVSVTGIGNHELPGLDIVTCAALLHTNHGKVILIMHEYACYGRGNTIPSPGQIEWFQNACYDKSFHVGATSYHLPRWVCHSSPV